MTRPSAPDPITARAQEEAVQWHVRLTSELASEADWLAFETWLDAAPDNGAAYARVEALVSDLEAPPAPVVTLASRRRRRTWAWPVGIAASITLAASLGAGMWLQRSGPPATVYETAKGATRQIALADGTHIRLNSGSRLSVTLARNERRVTMADAEAAFDVAKDPSRPFLIEAGDRTIRVVGTEFDVLHHAGRFTVTVRRGIVEVRPTAAGPAAAPIARLVKGQALAHEEGAGGDVISTIDPDRAFSWTAGRLVYDDVSLADVAADLGRYGAAPITVAPDARDLRLTAVIQIDSQDAMVRRLSAFLPVTAVHEAGGYRLSSRRK